MNFTKPRTSHFFGLCMQVQMIKVEVIRAIYGSSSPIPSSRTAITGAGAQRLSLLRFSFQFQLFMMNDDDDKEVVLVEGEGRRSLRVVWSARALAHPSTERK